MAPEPVYAVYREIVDDPHVIDEVGNDCRFVDFLEHYGLIPAVPKA